LVPSLTETLIECGVEVIGRTRFCVHPLDKVRTIPVVGGTKEINWGKCSELNPSLVVVDKEENKKEMADSCPFPFHATHITSIQNISSELEILSSLVFSTRLKSLANKWKLLADGPDLRFGGWNEIPTLSKRIGTNIENFEKAEYMIWRDPWMTAGSQTFIGSVLKKIGLSEYLPTSDSKYPTLNPRQTPNPSTFYLFSSEPFPFERYMDDLERIGFNGALVDGEFFSWFGSRSYRMLSDLIKKAT
jgi:hypothetical protein